MQTLLNFFQRASEFFRWHIPSCSVRKVTGENNISHCVTKGWYQSINGWFEGVPGTAVENEIYPRPVTFTFLLFKQRNDVLQSDIAWKPLLLSPGLCSLGKGVKNSIFSRVKFLLRFSLKAPPSICRLVLSACFSGPLSIFIQPYEGVETHTDHAVPVLFGSHAFASSGIVMPALAKFSQVLAAIVKLNFEGRDGESAFADVGINEISSFHGLNVYNGWVELPDCMQPAEVEQHFYFGGL